MHYNGPTCDFCISNGALATEAALLFSFSFPAGTAGAGTDGAFLSFSFPFSFIVAPFAVADGSDTAAEDGDELAAFLFLLLFDGC